MESFEPNGFFIGIDEYFNQLLPQIEPFSMDAIPADSTFIGVAGFEDRCFSFIDKAESLNKKFKNTIIIKYIPFNEKNREKEFEDKINNITLNNRFSYLFSWDEIPEHDNGRLIEFLKHYNIDGVDTAKIEKIDDDRTIRISTGKKSLSLKLNDEKTKVNLIIDDRRIDEFISKTESGKLNIYRFCLIYDRFNPEKFCNDFVDFKKEVWETSNVVIDISSMSKFLIIVILDILKEYHGDVHIIYSEAKKYYPTREKFEAKKQEEPKSTPTFLTKDVYKIVTTTSLSSISMQGYPLLTIAFPTFNHIELMALLSEMTPQYLIKIEGIPHEQQNHWRLDAIHWLNRKIDESYIYNIKKIIHETATTFDYKELVKNLDKIYKNFRYTHKCVIAPTGSKLQTLGVFIFKQMHPEVQIVYPVTKDFAEEYSEGCKYIWHVPIYNFFGFVSKLSEHNQYKLISLKNKTESDQNRLKYILHLSDIHLGTVSEARKYRNQLEADLIKNLKINKLDYLVISGDIANCSTPNEYEAAVELFDEFIKRFGLDDNHIITVPGNHDLNWDLSEEAYSFVSNRKLPNPLPDGKYIPAGDTGLLLRDEVLYQQRFANFSTHFYKKMLNGTQYPLDYAEQGVLYLDPDNRLLFLALNSCWEIDHYKPHHDRSSINPDALSYALDKLLDSKYNDWLKIAVWHHPIFGPEMMKNVDFLQQLVVHDFQICMHGHIHEAIEGYHKYDDKRGIHIVGAGTFGAPKREQTTCIPLQYNLLVYDPERHKITVETRKREKPDGAWSADARWGDLNNPKPRYKINLK
jgi:predicted MPP superfamily phosphohydrolase